MLFMSGENNRAQRVLCTLSFEAELQRVEPSNPLSSQILPAQEEVRITRLTGHVCKSIAPIGPNHTRRFNKGREVWESEVQTEKKIKMKEAVFWHGDPCSKCCCLLRRLDVPTALSDLQNEYFTVGFLHRV